MKILLAADGSKFTKKALTFLVKSNSLATAADELIVLNVQDVMSLQIKNRLGSAEVDAYQTSQADKVLKPIQKLLDKEKVNYRCIWVVGSAASEIIRVSKKERVQMIVMGAHGHGMLARALMGSVAQRVMADGDVPVLMVK